MFKEQKGVTLIALVITIIVLLILAGVSIAMLTGDNGILTKASSSNETNSIAQIKEDVSLAVSEIMANKADPTYNGNFSIAAGSTSNAEEAAGIITLTPKAKDDNGADVTVTGKVSAQGVITWSDITK